ncbi:DUF389 domain-containing protein [Falsiroseomonas sp. E2-1-a20]|uniref:DUF389 domain-containing protein n=1 Tax=Falsiroseomonas sp. E2-1-a20 TaxID=3239300 RepID=UPI003F35E348
MTVRVPRGYGRQVLATAAAHGGQNLASLPAEDEGGEADLVLASLPNSAVGPLLDALERLPDLHVTLAPQGVITLRPPAAEAPDQATDVGPRSPIEVFLGGLQSVGSWTGFLSYAAAAGIVVWIGLFTNTVYLLTAAMLIAPFAGPAMNAALATARGDAALFGRSLGRYLGALSVTIAVAATLSLLMGQQVASNMMVSTSTLSSVAALLPLVAGAAGALNLCQSERSSLVSGAATGMLVAASLAPPAGVLGMAATFGDWDMVRAAGFVLLLQLVGINLSGAVVFHLFGLRPQGVRLARGRGSVGIAAWLGSAAVLAGLLTWQFADPPELQRSTRAQRAAAEVRQMVEASGVARLVEADLRFTRADIQGKDTLLAVVHVQADAAAAVSQDTIRRDLSRVIRDRLGQGFNATPLVDLTVLE